MKLISLCSSLLLAGTLLFLTSAKPIADKKNDIPLYAYPSITVKNSTLRDIVVELNYGISQPRELIKAGTTHTFPNRGGLLLYKISICCPVPIGFKTLEFVEWKKVVGCGRGCSNFTISSTGEDSDKVTFSVKQD